MSNQPSIGFIEPSPMRAAMIGCLQDLVHSTTVLTNRPRRHLPAALERGAVQAPNSCKGGGPYGQISDRLGVLSRMSWAAPATPGATKSTGFGDRVGPELTVRLANLFEGKA